jgi:ParB family chromosome partitioning protein
LLPWLAGLADAERMELLALCVAVNLNDVHDDEKAGPLDPLCAMLGLDMADWWEAKEGTYFQRVTKDQISQAITEAAGPDVAARYKGVSKAELARVAERDLSGKRWVPAPLRARAAIAA